MTGQTIVAQFPRLVASVVAIGTSVTRILVAKARTCNEVAALNINIHFDDVVY